MSRDAREKINWQYGLCPLDAGPEAFGPFSSMVRLWSDHRPLEGGLPSRADFDFFDFRGWWGNLSIGEFETDPFDVRFVLWGTKLAQWWGVNYTKKRLGERALDPDLWKQVESKYFELMVAEPFIGLVLGHLDQHERPFVKVIGVDLPLSDGDRISHVLSAHIKIDNAETLEDHIPSPPIFRTF